MTVRRFAGDRDGDVLEVVLPGAAHDQVFFCHSPESYPKAGPGVNGFRFGATASTIRESPCHLFPSIPRPSRRRRRRMPGLDPGNEWIRVVVGDLASEPADAVVRPADAALGPADPAAHRLDEAGGEAFALLRRNTTPLEAGRRRGHRRGGPPRAIGAPRRGSDPARKVGRELLRKALVSAWQRAGDWGLAVLATPPVGVGTGQLTLQESADVAGGNLPQGRRLPSAHRRVERIRSGRRGGHRPEDDVIRLHKLTKRYGKFTAVDGIDLAVPRGRAVRTSSGPTAPGKTTTSG